MKCHLSKILLIAILTALTATQVACKREVVVEPEPVMLTDGDMIAIELLIKEFVGCYNHIGHHYYQDKRNVCYYRGDVVNESKTESYFSGKAIAVQQNSNNDNNAIRALNGEERDIAYAVRVNEIDIQPDSLDPTQWMARLRLDYGGGSLKELRLYFRVVLENDEWKVDNTSVDGKNWWY